MLVEQTTDKGYEVHKTWRLSYVIFIANCSFIGSPFLQQSYFYSCHDIIRHQAGGWPGG